MLTYLLTALKPLAGGPPNGFHYDQRVARSASIDSVYSIPRRLIEAIRAADKTFFATDELAQETDFTQICRAQHAVGVFRGNFIVHSAFRDSPLPITDEEVKQLGIDFIKPRSAAAFNAAISRKMKQFDPLKTQAEGYLGWLTTNPQFLAERDILRNRWHRVLATADGLPQLADGTCLSFQSQPPQVHSSNELHADFRLFYDRWHLLGLVTWDLPKPRMGNMGMPPSVGNLAGLSQYPALQLSPTLRLPARLPVQEFVGSHLYTSPHLNDWSRIQNKPNPGVNCRRMQRAFHLHFLRECVIGSRYGACSRNRQGVLDRAFASYFGVSADSVRKLRHWIARRLKVSLAQA